MVRPIKKNWDAQEFFSQSEFLHTRDIECRDGRILIAEFKPNRSIVANINVKEAHMGHLNIVIGGLLKVDFLTIVSLLQR